MQLFNTNTVLYHCTILSHVHFSVVITSCYFLLNCHYVTKYYEKKLYSNYTWRHYDGVNSERNVWSFGGHGGWMLVSQSAAGCRKWRLWRLLCAASLCQHQSRRAVNIGQTDNVTSQDQLDIVSSHCGDLLDIDPNVVLLERLQ